jgi:uncharacterized membrane protein YphA (DoxX/SURF4 family)
MRMIKNGDVFMCGMFCRLHNSFFGLFTYLTSVLLLGLRLHFGWGFYNGSWAKLNNPAMVEMFGGWGVPYPEIMTPFVGYVEMIGGILLMVGLLSRISGLFLFGTMIGAFATAHVSAVKKAFATFHPGEWLAPIVGETAPFEFGLAALLVAILGGGFFSLDTFFCRKGCE